MVHANLRHIAMVLATLAISRTLHNQFNGSNMTLDKDFPWLTTRNMSVYVRPSEDTTLIQPQLNRCFQAPSDVIFILGVPDDAKTQETIETEREMHNDILQEDFSDHYLNLTLKTSFMLKWLERRNAPSDWDLILKIDDDVLLNVDYLASEMDRFWSRRANEYLFMGHLNHQVPVFVNWRTRHDAPNEFYPDYYYPDFLCGPAYIFSSNLISPLYQCTVQADYINLEDVFLGQCATRALNLSLQNDNRFLWRPPLWAPEHPCVLATAFTVHPIKTETEMRERWQEAFGNGLCKRDACLEDSYYALHRRIDSGLTLARDVATLFIKFTGLGGRWAEDLLSSY